MAKRLQDGMRIGNLTVVAGTGIVGGADGLQRLSPDRMQLLLTLAEAPDEKVSIGRLCTAASCDADAVSHHIDAIKKALGDVGPHPRFIVFDDKGATLIAPVQEGLGASPPLPDDDNDADATLFQQLHRRKVIRVAAGYIVLAWIAIQVADTVMPRLGMPAWAITTTIAVAMLGFPFAVSIAWLFEATAIGTLRDERRTPAALSTQQKIVDLVVLGGLAAVVIYLATGVLSDVQQTRDNELLVQDTQAFAAATNTIAVLPFRHLGADPRNSYIGDGIAEEVLRLLSKLQEFNVAARAASFYFKDKDFEIEAIATKLKVRHVLTGSVQIAGESIRINAELLDATTGFQLWSDSYDREFVDIFAIQSEIARAVADGSKVVLSDDSNSVLDYRPTNNLEAYDYYLRGRDYLRKPRTTDTLQDSQRLFHRALALDPDYALALSGLCDTHLALYIRTKSTATVDDAESDCRAALEKDDSLPEVHTALGNLYLNTGDFDKAETEFRIAMRKDPHFYEAFTGLGDVLTVKNQLTEARLVFEQLIELQPAYWRGYQRLGVFFYRQGKDPEALVNFRQVTDLTPDNAPGWNNLGSVSFMLGDLEAAASAWQRSIDLAPAQSTYANLGTMYYYLGRYEDAVEMQNSAIETAPNDYRAWGRLAAAYLQMDSRNIEATAAFNRAISLANEGLTINPNDADVLKNLGLFQARIGNGDVAQAATTRALELSPADPDTHFFAALTYLALEDPDRCLRELEQAVALGYSTKLISSEPALSQFRENERFEFLISSTPSEAH